MKDTLYATKSNNTEIEINDLSNDKSNILSDVTVSSKCKWKSIKNHFFKLGIISLFLLNNIA